MCSTPPVLQSPKNPSTNRVNPFKKNLIRDLSNADCIKHALLIAQLHAYGFYSDGSL